MHGGAQGHHEFHHGAAEDGGLAGAFQGHGQGGGAGHGAHGGQVSGAVVTDHLRGIAAGQGAADAVEHGQPDEVAHDDDEHHHDEHGQVAAEGAFIGQAQEGQAHEERQDGDHDAIDQGGHDAFHLAEDLAQGLGLGPDDGHAHGQGQHQGAHDAEQRRDVQTEDHLGQGAQGLGAGGDGEVGDDAVAGDHGEQGRAQRGDVGQGHGHQQDLAGVLAQTHDGGGDEAHDDQGHQEEDDLAEDMAQGDHHVHDVLQGAFGVLADVQTKQGADDDAAQQFENKGKIADLSSHPAPPGVKIRKP